MKPQEELNARVKMFAEWVENTDYHTFGEPQHTTFIQKQSDIMSKLVDIIYSKP
jgi:hypothetical protein